MRLFALAAAAVLSTVLVPPVGTRGEPSVTQYDPSDCPVAEGKKPLRREHGTYVEYAGGRLQRQSIFELSAIRDSLQLQQPKTIVVHVHGGLVDRCAAFDDVDDLGPDYRGAGAFPIFVIYHTGPVESAIAGAWIGTGAYTVEDPRSAALFPRMARMSRDLKDRENRGRLHASVHTSAMEERYRYAPLLNFGLYRGGRAWSYMKWVVDQSMRIDSAGNDEVIPTTGVSFAENEPGGLALARVLHEYLDGKRAHGAPAPRIMLVGHSTGAIYITKFIRAWHRDYENDPTRFEVVFEAPAVRYDDFAQLFGPAVSSAKPGIPVRPADRIDKFRTFTMRDEFEQYTPEVGATFAYYIYGPSLLYAISGVFEDFADTPLLGMQRFQCPPSNFADYGAGPHDVKPHDVQMITDVKAWLRDKFDHHPFAYSPAISDRVPATFRTQSVKHGNFPRELVTRASIDALLANYDNWTVSEADSKTLDVVEQCGYADKTVVVSPSPEPTTAP